MHSISKVKNVVIVRATQLCPQLCLVALLVVIVAGRIWVFQNADPWRGLNVVYSHLGLAGVLVGVGFLTYSTKVQRKHQSSGLDILGSR